jgi:flagellar motor switch protein FliN/FliY
MMNDGQNTQGGLGELDLLEMEDLFGTGSAVTAPQASGHAAGMAKFMDVPLTVTLEVASCEVTLGELANARAGDVLPLDKAVGEPLDVKVNGVLFAKAEVVMVNGKYGLKFVSPGQSDAQGLAAAGAAVDG